MFQELNAVQNFSVPARAAETHSVQAPWTPGQHALCQPSGQEAS